MNIQSEKIRLIEWLAGLTDLTTLEKLSKVRQESLKEAYEANLKPMTPEELKERALKSNQDIAEGKVYDIESILKP